LGFAECFGHSAKLLIPVVHTVKAIKSIGVSAYSKVHEHPSSEI
jgi:hypothetical protein